MDDWDANLQNAAWRAHRAAERPVARAVLDGIRAGRAPPNLAVSAKAWARLLDLAILTGDAELAAACAAQSAQAAAALEGRRSHAHR